MVHFPVVGLHPGGSFVLSEHELAAAFRAATEAALICLSMQQAVAAVHAESLVDDGGASFFVRVTYQIPQIRRVMKPIRFIGGEK